MQELQRQLKARETWVQCYEQLGSVSKAARRCGIARSTLYRWIKRYKQEGQQGLRDRSKCPRTLVRQKVSEREEQVIVQIRKEFAFGPQRIHTQLQRVHGIPLSSPTIWRVLKRKELPVLKKYRSHRDFKRYSRPVPGDRVQLDVMKVGPKCYQFTAIDDCTRMRVLKLYSDKKAQSAAGFLNYVLETFQFPIQRVQTDRGAEFVNELFQQELEGKFIKFRPVKPRSPHLNGKVERSQLSDRAEFYATIPHQEKNVNLADQLVQWQHFYNHQRPHSSLGGKTPYEKFQQVQHLLPTQAEVINWYKQKQEKTITNTHHYWCLVTR